MPLDNSSRAGKKKRPRAGLAVLIMLYEGKR